MLKMVKGTQTYDREIAKYEEMKIAAVASWDGSAYVEACEGLGIEPEFQDLYEQGLAEIQFAEWGSFAKGENGNLEGLADSGNVTKTSKRTRKPSKNHGKYGRFINATKQEGVDVDRTMADIETKKRILIDVMGYTNLMGQGGRVNILEAKDSRIGEAYKSCYNQARKNHPDL